MTKPLRPPYPPMRLGFIALLLVVAWAALQPSTGPALFPFQDKLVHAGAYAVLYGVGAWAYGGARVSWPLHLSLLAYGALIEWLQAGTGYRHAEWADMAANAVGLALGNLAVIAWDRSRGR